MFDGGKAGSAGSAYSITKTGVFYSGQETAFVHVPCILRGDNEKWLIECHNTDDLRRAIELCHAEPDSNFDLDEVCEWAFESLGDRSYTAFESLHPHGETTRGIPHWWVL